MVSRERWTRRSSLMRPLVHLSLRGGPISDVDRSVNPALYCSSPPLRKSCLIGYWRGVKLVEGMMTTRRVSLSVSVSCFTYNTKTLTDGSGTFVETSMPVVDYYRKQGSVEEVS